MTRSPTSGMSRRRRPPALVLVPVVALVAVVGGALVLLNPRADELPRPSGAPAAFAPPPSPLVVEIDRAASGPAHVGYPDRVTVSALGRGGVAALELWSGTERLELAVTPNAARPSATARWTWTPKEPGEQVLVARAYDAAGRSTQSAAVRVRVVADVPQAVQLVEEAALAGETLDAVAARLGLDPTNLRSDNADLPDGPLPDGTTIVVRKTVDVPVPPAAGATDGFDPAFVADTAPVLAVGLATPQLEVAVDDCSIEATASDGGTESVAFAFSALPPVGDTFVPLPPVAPDDDGAASTSFLALAGLNLVTVSSYDADATAPSAIVPVVVPPECNGGWSGDASLLGGELVVPGTADRAYLYLRIGDSAWQRVPAGGEFVTPVGGTFDFSPYLPALGGSDLRLEAWGWAGGSLVKLGAGQYTAPEEEFYSGGLDVVADPVLGFGTHLDIVLMSGYDPFVSDGPTEENQAMEALATQATADRPGPGTPSVTKKFKWSTTVPGVTDLVVQVLPYPLGTSSTTLTPPFLIDSKTISVQGLKTGYFELDLKPYILGSTSATWSSQLLGEQLISQLSTAGAYGPAPTKAPSNVMVEPGSIWFPQPSASPSGGSTSGGSATVGSAALANETVEDLAAITTLALTAIYVRVIPFVGTSSVPNASNSVVFDIVEPGEPFYINTSPPAPPPSYLDAYTLQASFIPPTGSLMKYYHCAIVVETTQYWKTFYPVGSSLCPKEEDDGWSIGKAFESFTSWVGDVWDFAVGAYSWVKEQVVNAVLLVVPCETIAKTATNADDEDAKATCKVIAKTALDAALATFGIPPEIPDWKALMTAAKGDLKAFILEQAKTIPGVSEACLATDVANEVSNFTTCEELIDEAIDEILAQVAKERSDAAAKYLGYGLPDGVLVEPHPSSMPQPPHFVVTLTRTNAPLPADAVCSISASMTSKFGDGIVTRTWHEYEWDDGNPTEVTKGPMEVTGQPFLSTSYKVQALSPGDSATFEIWLSKPNKWFEPDGYNDWYAEQWALWNESSTANHSWVLLQKGATVTGKLSSNCTYGGQSIQVLAGQAAS